MRSQRFQGASCCCSPCAAFGAGAGAGAGLLWCTSSFSLCRQKLKLKEAADLCVLGSAEYSSRLLKPPGATRRYCTCVIPNCSQVSFSPSCAFLQCHVIPGLEEKGVLCLPAHGAQVVGGTRNKVLVSLPRLLVDSRKEKGCVRTGIRAVCFPSGPAGEENLICDRLGDTVQSHWAQPHK